MSVEFLMAGLEVHVTGGFCCRGGLVVLFLFCFLLKKPADFKYDEKLIWRPHNLQDAV